MMRHVAKNNFSATSCVNMVRHFGREIRHFALVQHFALMRQFAVLHRGTGMMEVNERANGMTTTHPLLSILGGCGHRYFRTEQMEGK